VAKNKEAVEQVQSTASKFTKQQILSCFRFKHNGDLINTLLKKGELYTLDEAESLIENYLKGTVI
jgi:hypothetical protein